MFICFGISIFIVACSDATGPDGAGAAVDPLRVVAAWPHSGEWDNTYIALSDGRFIAHHPGTGWSPIAPSLPAAESTPIVDAWYLPFPTVCLSDGAVWYWYQQESEWRVRAEAYLVDAS